MHLCLNASGPALFPNIHTSPMTNNQLIAQWLGVSAHSVLLCTLGDHMDAQGVPVKTDRAPDSLFGMHVLRCPSPDLYMSSDMWDSPSHPPEGILASAFWPGPWTRWEQMGRVEGRGSLMRSTVLTSASGSRTGWMVFKAAMCSNQTLQEPRDTTLSTNQVTF